MSEKSEANKAELEEALEEASGLADAGELESALQLLLQAEPDHTDEPTLLCMIGVVAQHLGAEGMATDYFRRCLAAEPTDPELLVRAGAGLSGAGDPAAEPALRLATITAPDFAPAHLHYGGLLLRSGLLDQGVEELKTALELDQEDPETHRELAVGFYLTSRIAEAIDSLERAVDLDQTDPESRILLGLLLLQTDEVGRSAEELHGAVTATAEDGDIQLLMALVFALAGWMDEAWLAVSRAETAQEPADSVLVREVEEALEEGEAAMRRLLMDDLAPTALRTRIYRVP